MKTKRTSIDTIAEVLVDELGKMEANTKQIQKESLRMQQIASKPIEVNTEPIRAILKRFETLSTQKSLVPVWSYVVTVVSVVLLCAACLVAYLQYQDKEQAQGRVETFSQYIRESDQVERFNQWLDSPE